MEKKKYEKKQALKFLIWQLLELVDKGSYVGSAEVKSWIVEGQVISQLFDNYHVPLLTEINTYNYYELDQVLKDYYPLMHLDYFDNGFIGLANSCVEILGQMA